jgi:hypothetical protein
VFPSCCVKTQFRDCRIPTPAPPSPYILTWSQDAEQLLSAGLLICHWKRVPIRRWSLFSLPKNKRAAIADRNISYYNICNPYPSLHSMYSSNKDRGVLHSLPPTPWFPRVGLGGDLTCVLLQGYSAASTRRFFNTVDYVWIVSWRSPMLTVD